VIILDHSAALQNQKRIMNRYAADEMDPDFRENIERSITWEDKVGMKVYPRRSPWRTANEDSDAADPKVSDKQVPATTQNIQNITYVSSGGGSSSTAGGNSYSIDQIVQAVIAALPVVDFECPS